MLIKTNAYTSRTYYMLIKYIENHIFCLFISLAIYLSLSTCEISYKYQYVFDRVPFRRKVCHFLNTLGWGVSENSDKWWLGGQSLKSFMWWYCIWMAPRILLLKLSSLGSWQARPSFHWDTITSNIKGQTIKKY